MTINSIPKKRQAQIRELKGDWLQIIEEQYLSEGMFEMSVWPDEELIYFGNDADFWGVVERYDLEQETTGKRDTLWNTY